MARGPTGKPLWQPIPEEYEDRRRPFHPVTLWLGICASFTSCTCLLLDTTRFQQIHPSLPYNIVIFLADFLGMLLYPFMSGVQRLILIKKSAPETRRRRREIMNRTIQILLRVLYLTLALMGPLLEIIDAIHLKRFYNANASAAHVYTDVNFNQTSFLETLDFSGFYYAGGGPFCWAGLGLENVNPGTPGRLNSQALIPWTPDSTCQILEARTGIILFVCGCVVVDLALYLFWYDWLLTGQRLRFRNKNKARCAALRKAGIPIRDDYFRLASYPIGTSTGASSDGNSGNN